MKAWATSAILVLVAIVCAVLYQRTGIRVLAAAAFLATGGLTITLGHVQVQHALQHMGTGRSSAYLNIAISLLWVNLALVQYWLLTTFYSMGWMLILSGVVVVQLVIFAVLGAVSGISLPDRKAKIEALAAIWGAQSGVEACIVSSFSFVATAVSWIGSLWIFWANPIGSDDTKIGVALFLFVVPAVFFLPTLFAFQWPYTTSPYLDDDVRNATLVRSLNSMVNNAVVWLFPVWLFREQFSARFPDLPPFWALLSIPVIVFVITGLMPFFVGAYRYRLESAGILDWRKDWIADLLRILDLPAGEHRQAEIDLKRRELEGEIARRFRENDVINLYSSLADLNGEPDSHPLVALSATTSADDSPKLPSAASSAPALWNEASLARGVASLREFRPSNPNPSAPPGDMLGRLMDLIVTNIDNLKKWDVRFSHIDELAKLHRHLEKVQAEELKAFLNTGLVEIETKRSMLEPKRSYVFGGLLGLMSTVAISLFRIYGEEIISTVGRVVGIEGG